MCGIITFVPVHEDLHGGFQRSGSKVGLVIWASARLDVRCKAAAPNNVAKFSRPCMVHSSTKHY